MTYSLQQVESGSFTKIFGKSDILKRERNKIQEDTEWLLVIRPSLVGLRLGTSTFFEFHR